ncbi:RING-H2 finger protein ATL32-like [Impatiens glandulifera]|uniref:RING-H2 finger protein ATL32-like n=1 Tax=Impatiens glandulifera TaxID=253017 RepID=UPI001FB0B9C6|nr:RING-H2 finger protein ATL32-like [Impatiens glandulifera]
MGCIFITLKELLRRQITTAMQDQSDNRASCVSTCGINGVEIEGFPMFLYSDVKGIQTGDDDLLTMECNICLNEFEDDEMLRLLPICGHMFHPDCINTWLASHVTCPVCRDILVVPCPGQDTNTAPVTVLIQSGHDPVPVSEPCSDISGQT